MKLRNKKTGEIGKLHCDMNVSPAKYGVFEDTDIRGHYWEYHSLAELNKEWEDAPEEPKEYWYIDCDGGILCGEPDNSSAEKMMISMGNHFETIEEAEKAVEKLKAWKRLKDKGFRFVRIIERNEGHRVGQYLEFEMAYHFSPDAKQIGDDLDSLFSGEDD